MKGDKGCYNKPVQAKILSQHRHHLNIHSLVVLFHLKPHGYDWKQENHMPEIYPKKYNEYMTKGNRRPRGNISFIKRTGCLRELKTNTILEFDGIH